METGLTLCSYESNLLDIMAQYAVARTEYLTEKEVFVGTILGRSGAGSKYQREQSDYMKARSIMICGIFSRGWKTTGKWKIDMMDICAWRQLVCTSQQRSLQTSRLGSWARA